LVDICGLVSDLCSSNFDPGKDWNQRRELELGDGNPDGSHYGVCVGDRARARDNQGTGPFVSDNRHFPSVVGTRDRDELAILLSSSADWGREQSSAG